MSDAQLSFGEMPGHATGTVREAVDIYQGIATAAGWRKVGELPGGGLNLDSGRQSAIRKALQSYGGVAGFKLALERAAKSAFLTGKVGRTGTHANWKPSLDFFLQPKSRRALLDGAYDDPEGGHKAPETWREKQAREAREAVDRVLK